MPLVKFHFALFCLDLEDECRLTFPDLDPNQFLKKAISFGRKDTVAKIQCRGCCEIRNKSNS